MELLEKILIILFMIMVSIIISAGIGEPNVWVCSKSENDISIVEVKDKLFFCKYYEDSKYLNIKEWMRDNSSINDEILEKVLENSYNTENPYLTLAIICIESNFRPYVVSHKGAIGLMQIMPNIWVDELIDNKIIKNSDDLYKIEENIKSGNYVLSHYLKNSNNNLELALLKYSGYNKVYYKKVIEKLGELMIYMTMGVN